MNENEDNKSIVLKHNMRYLMTSLIPMAKKIVNKKIKEIKSRVMKNIQSNKKVSSNKFSVKATKNIINAPKIAIEKSPIVTKPNVVISSKIASKPKIATKTKKVDKPKIAAEKNINYNEYKNRIVKQLKNTL